MLLLLAIACTKTLDLPPEPTGDDEEEVVPCEPHDASFIGTALVQQHLGMCSDSHSAEGRLTMLRSDGEATCTSVLTFRGVSDGDCPSCAGAWGVSDVELDTDCSAELEALADGPELLLDASWIGGSFLGAVLGEVGEDIVMLPGNSPTLHVNTVGDVTFFDLSSSLD